MKHILKVNEHKTFKEPLSPIQKFVSSLNKSEYEFLSNFLEFIRDNNDKINTTEIIQRFFNAQYKEYNRNPKYGMNININPN